jgi:hypothetical protein
MHFAQRHLPWLASLLLGLLLLVAGGYLVFSGIEARDEVRNNLRDEQVMTTADSAVPNSLVEDEATAQAQADVIKKHTLGTWGPYGALPRDDPRRAQFIDGVALRTALNMAVMGFRLTELVIGTGAIVMLAGLATIAFATPGLYFLAGVVVAPTRSTGE